MQPGLGILSVWDQLSSAPGSWDHPAAPAMIWDHPAGPALVLPSGCDEERLDLSEELSVHFVIIIAWRTKGPKYGKFQTSSAQRVEFCKFGSAIVFLAVRR